MGRTRFSGPIRSTNGFEVGSGATNIPVIDKNGNLILGNGTPIKKIAVYALSLTPSAVAAATTAEQTFTVSGLTIADKVIVNGPTPVAGTGIVNARVSADNTLAITFVNVTTGALTPAAGTYTVIAIRS